ncbi:hypothetical protein [Haloarchaeobius sp. DFWS5]|uniref:hypothetical protein n=1 Tax=Haloarchaeobius sp. DFWS5 TaxID=3446114 RepID=UPI003EBF1936
MSHLRPGEQLVGAYLDVVEECDLVSYNQRSREQGTQFELDVLGVHSTDDAQTVFAAEVVTHLDGSLYGGTPSSERWTEFGGQAYQASLDKIWEKFERVDDYLCTVFDDASGYRLQLWAPKVSEGYLTDGLAKLASEFEDEYGREIELIVNDEYSDRIETLETKAAATTKDFGQPAFRYLQILNNLQ